MKILLLIAIVFAGLKAHAQQAAMLSGAVANEQNKPLEGVSVSLFAKGDTTAIQLTQTDKNGRYQFKNISNGSYSIKATAIGREIAVSALIEVTGETGITVPLLIMKAESKTLQSVTVSASSKAIEVKEGKLVYNVEKSAAAAGTTAFELLQRTPGITVDQNDNLLLKGSGTINVMLDGKMTYLSAQQLSNMLKSLPAENLTRIEVITTPSAQYDAAGTTGIINIITKKSNREGYAANISAGLGLGHYLLNTETITGNIKTKKFNLFGNLGYDFRNTFNRQYYRQVFAGSGLSTMYDRQTIETIKTYYYDYKIGADFYLSKKHQLGGSYTGYVDDWSRQSDGPTYIQDNSGLQNAVVQNDIIAIEPYYYNLFNANYQYTPDTTGKLLTADADYISYRNNSDGHLGNGLYDKDGVALQPYQQLLFHQPSNIDIRSVKTDAEYPLAALRLKAGLKYSSVIINNDFRYDSLINNQYQFSPALSDHFVYTEKIAAAYLSGAKDWKNTRLELGLRIEHTASNGNSINTGVQTQRNYTNLFPSLTFDQKLTDNYKLTLSVSRRINRPVYGYLNPVRYFSDKYSYYQGNPYLRPERSWATSLSYTLMDKYIATVSYRRLSDFITEGARMDSAGVLVTNSVNFLYASAADVTLVVPISIRSFWTINTVTQVAYDAYPLVQLAAIQNVHKWSVDVSVSQTFSLPRLGVLELQAHYTSPQLYGVYIKKYYFSFDGGYKKSFLKAKLDAKLSFSDLFHTNRYWGYSILKTVNYSYNSVKDSRRLRLTLTYHIGGKLSRGKAHRIDEENRL